MEQLQIKAKSATNATILIRSALENQMMLIDFGISKTERKLKEFEREFGMTSRKFYEKFSQGKIGDDFEYMKWAGEYETLQRLQKDHDALKDLELCS
jgi:hypothetical protein